VLEARLFPDAGTKQGHRRQVEPDWASIHRELKRKHVTLSILWDEYIVRDPEGYRYSRFCELYRIWAGKLSVTMRQTHVGGDKLFVDYAGDTVPVIIDRLTGELRQAQIFVAVMGASSFTYVEATWTQTIGDWIGAHTRALAAIGGVPRLIVPDMPRSPSSRPVCTSRRSTERTLRWRRITAPPCCRPDRDGRVTKPRSKLAC
jgi:transposase